MTDDWNEQIRRLEAARDCECKAYIGGPKNVQIYHEPSCRHYVEPPRCLAIMQPLGMRCEKHDGHMGRHEVGFFWDDDRNSWDGSGGSDA